MWYRRSERTLVGAGMWAALVLLSSAPVTGILPDLAAQDPDSVARRIDSTATLHGFVRDLGGRPLAGVDVVVLGIGRVAVTDAEGRFQLGSLPPGAVAVHVNQTWFAKHRRIVTLAPRSRHRLDVMLGAQEPAWCDEASADTWAIECRVPPARGR